MPIERRRIEKGLLKKGFVRDNEDHKMFRLVVNKKITHIKTWISHGSKYRDYSDSLLNLVKKELKLATKPQLINLINCSLEYHDYISYLKTNGIKF